MIERIATSAGALAASAGAMLAQASQVSQDAFVGRMTVLVVGAAGVFATVATAWIMAKRQPPVPEQMFRDFVRKEEFETERKENADTVRRIHSRIDDLTREMHRAHSDAERSRGTMIGKMETVESAVTELRDWVKDLFERRHTR